MADEESRPFATIAETSEAIRRREISPVELTQAVLDRIARLEPALRCYVTITPERALAAAREAESAIASGRWRGPLHGIPLSVKDLFHVRGVRTTAASRFLANAVADHDAAVVERLEAAGAVLLGKANLHEFAYGTTCDSSIAGAVRNPWNTDHIPGGSSGGSGASVAAGTSFASVGTDTGGSVRIPAASCGVVGLKPSFGRISRFGLLPLAPSMDHVGPLARSVEDAAILLDALAGADPRDPATLALAPIAARAACGGDAAGLRIGVLERGFADASREVAAAGAASLDRLRAAGATLHPISLARLDDARQAAFVTLFSESLVTHEARFRSEPEGFFPDVRARFERALPLTAADLVHASEAKQALCAELDAIFRDVDVIVDPTLPTGAPRRGAAQVPIDGRDVDVAVANTLNTREWNLTGLPAISVPCGFTHEGLPIGLQIAGPRGGEIAVLRAAAAHERLGDWHRRHPTL